MLRRWLAVCLVLVLLTSCVPITARVVRGSGNTVTVEVNATDFDEVSAGYAFEVAIAQGDDYQVLVTVDQNLEEYLRVGKQGSRLNIQMDPGHNYANATLRAQITMPELVGLELSGACRGSVTGFDATRDFDVEVSGASSLRGDMTTGDVTMNVSGASRAELEGSGQNLRLEASGASHVTLADFTVRNADVEVSGASSAVVNVSGRLDAEATGASSVRYRGDPQLGNIQASGAGSVRPD